MRIGYCTLGCKVNQYDTQAMRELLEGAGHKSVEFDEEADIYLVNTCTVTQTGDKKSRQMISRAHAKNPDAHIIVAGCFAQTAPEAAMALPGVDAVVGSKDRARIAEIVAQLCRGKKENRVEPLQRGEPFEALSAVNEGKTRAHLKIQEGCDRYCTYCIIPYARGPLRSRPPEQVREEFVKLAQSGFQEVVLTGIHLMSYGRDLPGNLNLLSAIAQADGVDGIRRVRLGSLEPQLTSEDFVCALAGNPKVCRQFHLSLQSGSAGVLRRMNRRYTPEEYRRCVALLREAMPDCAITTDIIVGFPGETEEEFEETLRFAREIGFARIHVFPYSRRMGTAAAKMPGQIPRAVKNERARTLIHEAERLEAAYLQSLVGTDAEVLFEESMDGVAEGYTGAYARLRAAGGAELCGTIRRVKVVAAQPLYLTGEMIDS